MGDQHYLVVPDDPDRAMDVEHPASCPQHGHVESVRTFDDGYACLFEEEHREVGLETSFRRDDMRVTLFHRGRVAVSPGRHRIECWYDADSSGLRLVGGSGSAA